MTGPLGFAKTGMNIKKTKEIGEAGWAAGLKGRSQGERARQQLKRVKNENATL